MKIPLFLSLALFFFINCSKDEYRKPVNAGIYDSSYFFREFSPPFKINIIWDSSTFIGKGSDSIDINLDGEYDLIFNSQVVDIYKYKGGFIYENCNIDFKNGFGTVSKKFYIPQGQGSYTSVTWIDTLQYKTQIQRLNSWGSKVSLWSIIPMGFAPLSPWYETSNPYLYIGLRRIVGNNVKYGWILADGTTKKEVKILSYAFEK